MTFLPLIILALIQGITEFLPISSSAHLILFHEWWNEGNLASRWQEDLMLDVAVHVGTLFSVLLYFRKDVFAMIRGLKDGLIDRNFSQGAKLDLYVIIGSVPVILAGLALSLWEPGWLRDMEIIAWTTIIFGILLWWADDTKPSQKTLDQLTLKDALIIGLMQVLALIPGTSRSGITMTAARILGYERSESARFSLLLAIIAIAGAGTLGAIKLIKAGNIDFTIEVGIAAFLAFISGWIAIALMMRWLEKSTFRPFAIYRIILGLGLLAFIYKDQFF